MSTTLQPQPDSVLLPPIDSPSDLPPLARGSLLLDTVRFTVDPDGYFAAAHRRYGDVFRMRLPGREWVAVADPKAVREVFSHGPDEVDSGAANDALSPALGVRNLLLLDGDEHLHRRRLVLPPFHGERMRTYEQTIRAAAREQIAAWPLGEPVAALPRMQELTFAVILRCVFGVQDDEHIARLSDALRQLIAWLTDMRRVLFFFLVGPDRLEQVPSFRRQRERVDREIFAEIGRRRRRSDLSDSEDILSLLIQAVDENGEHLSDLELRDELMTLLMAGYETTATLLSWALHDLSRDPASQERVATEGGAFTDAVITEALRLHPPTGGVVRRLREPLVIAGYELPAGVDVLPITLLVHRRADVYPRPWTFDPTRFLDARPPAGAWFPFGGSVRRCIGAAFAQFEAKIVLEELTAALRFSPADPRPERTSRRAIVLVPSKGARVVAERR
jgi:cytochrome P450 family 135